MSEKYSGYEFRSEVCPKQLGAVHRVMYNERLFGPSIFAEKPDKKELQKSGLKRSPPSDNLCRDSHESDTQSSTSQEASSSESSRATTPENKRAVEVPMFIAATFMHRRLSAKTVRVTIPERSVEECDKPLLIGKPVRLFKGLGTPF